MKIVLDNIIRIEINEALSIWKFDLHLNLKFSENKASIRENNRMAGI